jgi:NADH-quinone oxidoreductase subunit J
MIAEFSLTVFDIVFYSIALVILVSAGIVVFSRNIVRSAFSLLFTFVGVAGLYALLHADFIAVTQLLVYVGGILVLMLFGVMLTNKVVSVDIRSGSLQKTPAAVMTAILAGTLCGIFWLTEWIIPQGEAAGAVTSTAPIIGEALMTTYVLPFEIASVVLLVAMMGAAMLARRQRRQEPATEGRANP